MPTPSEFYWHLRDGQDGCIQTVQVQGGADALRDTSGRAMFARVRDQDDHAGEPFPATREACAAGRTAMLLGISDSAVLDTIDFALQVGVGYRLVEECAPRVHHEPDSPEADDEAWPEKPLTVRCPDSHQRRVHQHVYKRVRNESAAVFDTLARHPPQFIGCRAHVRLQGLAHVSILENDHEGDKGPSSRRVRSKVVTYLLSVP